MAFDPTGPAEIKGFCTFCRSRCGSISVVQDGRLVAVRPDPAHPTGKALCPKGRAAPEIVHSPERLTRPLRRTAPKDAADPGWTPVSWTAALGDIAARMRAIADEDGPEAVAFSMTSASASSISDARPWLERFIWAFGSPNICASAELCNWHKDHTHALTFGRGISTPDYAATDLAVLWGHNPSHVWLAEAEALGAARARGAGLVVIDPRRTPFAAQADLWLRITPGTDVWLAMAAARLLIDRGLYDEAFVRSWTNAPLLVRKDTGRFLRASEADLGPDGAFVAWAGGPRLCDPTAAVGDEEARACALEGEVRVGGIAAEPAFGLYRRALAQVSLDEAAGRTGLASADIEAFAEMLGAAPRCCYYAWTGVGQHANATQTDRAMATLFALKGQVDAPGGNIAWAGPPTNPIDDMRLLPPGQRAKALGLAERPLGPASRSWVTAGDLYRAILQGRPYRVRAVVAFGSNPLASRSEPETGRRALQALELQVHCDVFVNPTAQTADYLLPVNTAWEREGLRTGFEIDAEAQALVQLRPAMLPPVGESRSDFWIASELARRLGVGAALFDGDLDAAHDYVLAPSGLTVQALRAAGGAVRAVTADVLHSYARQGPDGVRGFATRTRRVELYSEPLAELGQPPVPDPGGGPERSAEFPLILTGGKFGHFCHSQHRQIPSLRARSPEPAVALSPDAAAARGLVEGDPVEVRSRRGSMRAAVRLDPNLDPGTAVGEFGWWQACDDLGAPAYPLSGEGSPNYNLLTSTRITDSVSHAPAFRSTPCEVARVAGAPARWSGFAPLEVAAVAPLTSAVVRLELRRADGAPLPPFRPGQFISVRLGDGEPRSYSLVGPAEAAPAGYAIAVKREPEGAVSPAMAALNVGETVLVTLPAGRFTLPIRNTRPIVLMAYGVGITPFMSLLETLAEGERPELHLFHCAPTPQEQAFRSPLLEHAARGVVALRSYFTRLPDGMDLPGDGARGRLAVADLPDDLFRRRARFYLCGGAEAVAEAQAGLLARGAARFEVFAERFVSPRATAGEAAAGPFRLRLARSDATLAWTGEGSILDALLAAGVPAASGCRVGQCESCAMRLIQGRVTYTQPPEDLDDGVFLPCIARPASDLDLDA